MRTIQRTIVGAFLIASDDKLLLVKSAHGGIFQGKWLVPGGGVDEGETHEAALRREVQEELGLDISDMDVKLASGASGGTSEKTLKETGEMVLVEMTYYDFVVRLDGPADSYQLVVSEELANARWFPIGEIPLDELGGNVRQNLERLGLVSAVPVDA